MCLTVFDCVFDCVCACFPMTNAHRPKTLSRALLQGSVRVRRNLAGPIKRIDFKTFQVPMGRTMHISQHFTFPRHYHGTALDCCYGKNSSHLNENVNIVVVFNMKTKRSLLLRMECQCVSLGECGRTYLVCIQEMTLCTCLGVTGLPG